MKLSNIIINKRKSLSLTLKEFSDALGLGVEGEMILREWENGGFTPDSEMIKKIQKFGEEAPYLKQPKRGQFRFIDLFAGIGGIRIPFQELGGKCVFSSEWDKFSQKTYRINFGEIPAGDITKIEAKDIPDFDILLGGFPCQPFSQAGLHKGFSDTRGTLVFEIERIIGEKRPKAFLLENVKQLKGHDDGRTFSVIMQHLDILNYHAEAKILRAADFGVPQIRERIYIVGFDKNYFDIPEDYSFPFPEPSGKTTRVGDILEKQVDRKYTISDRLWAGHQRRKVNNRQNGKGFGYSLFNEDSLYTSTISARYYKDGSEILIEQEGKNPRKLTPRECARLQGFPDEFIIPVSDAQAYKQFGNSVAVPVIRAIARHMKAEMKSLEVNREVMSDLLGEEHRSWNMSRIHSRDTKIEVLVRRYLFSKGYRFRKNDKRYPGKPDIVLPKYRTMIFVNGCFWHQHKECKIATIPKTRTEFWVNKLNRNVINDEKNTQMLRDNGWLVVVIWECELEKDFEITMADVIKQLELRIKRTEET